MSRVGNLTLRATSIYGEGDKIALPPSALEYLTSSGNDLALGSPWIFRIGILNPDYSFPASPLLQNLKLPDDDDGMESDDDDDEEEAHAAYLDELKHRYLSYTHGTVVEFTQDEDHIGLPEPIALALLTSTKDGVTIPARRTVDPATPSILGVDREEEDATNELENHAMNVDSDDEKTPGHLAWGAFDVPDLPVEVVLVQIPKGKACRLTPTPDAVKNGFYNLKDVKMVLEQSLIRTRATLSVGDLVHTWHRGAKYDLTVTEVAPATYNTVTCINTDIEVEFGQVDLPEARSQESTITDEQSKGYTLGSSVSTTAPTNPRASTAAAEKATTNLNSLRKEPPTEQKEGVCTVQIRAGGGNGRRRFDVQQATMEDLFAFATTIDGVPADKAQFQLVTRFPRREFRLNGQSSSPLEQVGVSAGQELFMVEIL